MGLFQPDSSILVGGALFKNTTNVSLGTIQSSGHSYTRAASNNADPSIQHGAFGVALWNVNGLEVRTALDISNIQSNGDFASAYLIEAGCQNIKTNGLKVSNINNSDSGDLFSRSTGIGVHLLTNTGDFKNSGQLTFTNSEISDLLPTSRSIAINLNKTDNAQLTNLK